MEQLLQYVWKHRIFPLKELQTTTGYPVEVIDSGLPNTDAGPDFFNAKIKINGTLWVGNVEIHERASDWNRHGHNSNQAYNSVILHVASEIDCDVRRAGGELVPQIQLACPEQISFHYEQLKRADASPACYPILNKLSRLKIHSWLSALQSERFEQKTELLASRLKRCQGGWEDAFFITLARNFGFGLNGDAFERWASVLPYRTIDKYRDNLFQVEAFFFGVAGLLEEEINDPYYQRLQKEHAYFRHVFSIYELEGGLWRFLRLRPGNFPHVRIAQLAWLYYSRAGLFSQVMGAEALREVKDILRSRTSEYWETHYTFNKVSPRKSKLVGDSSLELIIINTVTPFLYAYGKYKANDSLCERASTFLEELKAENNYITRMWSNAGLNVKNAEDSQALIQLKKEYCDKKKCLYCRIGFEYMKGTLSF